MSEAGRGSNRLPARSLGGYAITTPSQAVGEKHHIWKLVRRRPPRYGIIRVAVGVPSKLREARKAAGLTTREMASARGVSVRAVEQAEMRGERLREATYRVYVQAARDALIARADDMNSRLGQAG